MEKTAELQIKHAIEQAKHIKETVFKLTCHVPSIGELKKSSCLFLQSCYLFYIRQWAMPVPVQNKVVKSILYLETIHSLCFVESLSWPCDLKYEELPPTLALAIGTPEVLFQMCWGFVGYVIPMLDCSSLCSSPSFSIWVPANISLLSTHGSHQHRRENGRRMPVWWRAFPEKKGEIRILQVSSNDMGRILSSRRVNPAGFCARCSTVLLVPDLMYHDSIFVS